MRLSIARTDVRAAWFCYILTLLPRNPGEWLFAIVTAIVFGPALAVWLTLRKTCVRWPAAILTVVMIVSRLTMMHPAPPEQIWRVNARVASKQDYHAKQVAFGYSHSHDKTDLENSIEYKKWVNHGGRDYLAQVDEIVECKDILILGGWSK